jgi:deazaflavin-dependent oxidoreductase (nitroreductase family)
MVLVGRHSRTAGRDGVMRIEVPTAMYRGALREVNDSVVGEYRATGGQLQSAFVGAPILLLNHRGAKSGTTYTSPLAYSRSGDDYVVIASMGGAALNPQWFRNVVAHPEVTIEVGTELLSVRARVAQGVERDRLYRAQADQISNFDDYQARTERQIPVVVLERHS